MEETLVRFMIDNNFTQILTEMGLVEIYLGFYLMFNNAIWRLKILTLIKLKVEARQRRIALLVLHFSQCFCNRLDL